MNILKVDNEKFLVYGDSLEIQEKLVPQVYTVNFNKMQGFFLKLHEPLTVKEKLYGKHEAKVDKIISSFDRVNRSLGIIFSGNKGLGKSIAGRMLCEKMVAKGYPVLLVNEYIPGIVDFIESVKQECVVFFDEFEKSFRDLNDGDVSPQNEMLPLFDGTSGKTKRLYVITCNKLNQLNDFLINRPGRFHYHIRWDYPTAEEIREYLRDKLDPQYYSEIPSVVGFGLKVSLNYDCLRAIAFELNMGYTFKEAIEDLNILQLNYTLYSLEVGLDDGTVLRDSARLDLFSKDNQRCSFDDDYGCYVGQVSFKATKLAYDYHRNGYTLDPKEANSVTWDERPRHQIEDDDDSPLLPKRKIKSLLIKVAGGNNYRYDV